MVYSEARRRSFLSIGQRTTMLYALERESNLGSTFASLVELSEGRDVGRGPVSRVWDFASNGLPLDQSLQRNRAGRTRRSQPPPAHLFPCDAGANRERHTRASYQTSVLGRAEAQGHARDSAGRCGVACGQYVWQYPEPRRLDPSAKEAKTHFAVLRAVLDGDWSQSAPVR
jgi:hypothetical protein